MQQRESARERKLYQHVYYTRITRTAKEERRKETEF